MKKTNSNGLRLVLIAMFLLIGNVNAQSGVMVKNEQEVHLKRSSILVSDLEKSLEVYRGVLGFKVASIVESEKESYAYQVFRIPKEANMRVATLNSSDQNRIINLKEVTGISLPKPTSSPYMSTVLIKVNDLHTVMKKIKHLGLELTEEHTVKGTRLSYKEQSFVDPDGHLVALYEILNK
ncbi:VOC family protein [uncultured Maribacter sp.]|uniref:VOC family protein n=1 Tax=uncultured Maribacter sp. TaxID=431308 RepID=UPI002638D8B5|nr:VOC family protein [uncultured Maribacter sp.]